MHREVCKRGSVNSKNERTYETWSQVNESFSDAAFIAVSLSISLMFFSIVSPRKLKRSWHIFSLSHVTLSVRAVEDLYQVRGGVAPILRKRCDKVTLRNWLSWRGERLAGSEGKLSPGEPRLPFSSLYPFFLPSTKSNSIVLRSGTATWRFLLVALQARPVLLRETVDQRKEKRESKVYEVGWKRILYSRYLITRRGARDTLFNIEIIGVTISISLDF